MSGKGDKLPKIREDPDTGRRYVMVGKKRIWLSKGVTKKTLLKFLLKLRKKIKRSTLKRRRSTTKKKVDIKPAVFGENISRSIVGEAALSLAAKALMNSSVKPTGAVDTDKVEKDIKAIKALIKANDGGKDAVIPYKGVKVGYKELEQLERLHGDLAGQLKGAEEKVQAKDKEVKAANDKLELEKRIQKLNDRISNAKKNVLDVARETLTKENTGKTLSKYLTEKAKQYKIPGTRIDDLLEPVVYRMMKEDEADFSEFENVVKAGKEEKRLKRKLKDVNKPRKVNFAREEQRPQAKLEEVKEEKEREEKKEEADDEETTSEEDERERIIRAKGKEMAAIASIANKELEEFRASKKRKRDIDQPNLENAMRAQVELNQMREASNEASKRIVLELNQMRENAAIRARDEAIANIQAEHVAQIERRNREAEELKVQYPDNAAKIEEMLQDYIVQMEQMTQAKINSIKNPQGGDGRRRSKAEEGLSTSQINDIMKPYPDYIGCIGSDQIMDFNVKPQSRFGFVMNTDPSYKAGEHWVAVYVDARPNGSQSIEYYDSLADLPTRQVFQDLKELAISLRPTAPLLFKMNKVADQSDDSSNCGYFAAKFLVGRFNGKSFAEASGYNQRYPEGERQIEAWKKHLGIEKFRPIEEQTGEGFRDVIRSGIDYVKRGVESVKQRVKDVMQGVRKHASPSVRSWLEKYGDMEVVEMKICRKPIFSVIEKLANFLSNGRWEENKEKLSYDKLMHLFVLIKIEPDGLDKSAKVFKIEKNHVVEFRQDNWNTDNKTETIPFQVHTNFKIGKLMSAAEKRVGADKLWIYDARTQNCQYFIKWVFGSESGWDSNVEKFVMQDAEKVLEGMGVLGKIAKVVTDVAGVGDVALNGAGRRGRGGRR